MSKKEKKEKVKIETPKAESNDVVPEKLKIYVSQDIWNSWSPIRRESFKQIIKNPNTFFYRNRPPGDPQKVGPFTAEEEKQFISRINYFRDILQIDDGLWGLFSVPIRGRLGYQCSNFYRQLIKDGKLKDDKYEIVDGKLNFKRGQKKSIDPSSIEVLEKEAFAFIESCLSGADTGNAPQMQKPVRVAPPISKPKQQTSKQIHQSNEEVKVSGTPITGHSRRLQERRISPLDSNNMNSGGAKTPFRNLKKEKLIFEEENSKCPLHGALDPLTKDPIKVPMMDTNGFVMDLSSWKKVFRQGYSEIDGCTAVNENEIIEISGRNYNKYRLMITNIPC